MFEQTVENHGFGISGCRSLNLGVHGALLAARLNAAAGMGLEVAYTDVEHGSQSHYNCERAGFRTLTINTIWERQA